MNTKIEEVKDITKRKNLILFLLSTSLFLLILTFVQFNLGSPEPSAFWYLSTLPLTFWVGLIISIITLLLSYRHHYAIKILAIVLPALYLYTIPAYAHDLPPVYDVYHVIPIPLHILEVGNFTLQEYNFPLSHIFWANNLEILNVKPLQYARLFPTIFATSITLLLYSATSKITKRYASVAPIAFLSMYWYMEAHMARQSFTLILWTLFIITLLIFFDSKTKRFAGITLLLALSILITHPGQTIFLFFNLISLSVISILFIKNKEVWDYLKPVHIVTAIIGLTFLYIYHNIEEVQELFQDIYDRVKERGIGAMDLGYRIKNSESYALANSIRAVKMISQSLLGLSAVTLAVVNNCKRSLTAGIIFLSCYLWLIYPLSNHGRYLERTFMAAVIPASIIIAYLFTQLNTIDNKTLKTVSKTSLLIFLIALLLTVPLTKNSIDSFETPSNEALQAGRFLQAHHEGRVDVTDTHEGLFRYLESTNSSETSFRSISGGSVLPTNGIKTGYQRPQTDRDRPNHLFVDYFKNYFIVRFGNETIAEEIDEYEVRYQNDQAKVYDSGGARFYTETQ
ncbi:MAG: hypothetical protein ACOCT7_01795 [Candidatus Saliniplasma sp.]